MRQSREEGDPVKQAQKRQKEDINGKLRQIAEQFSNELEKEITPLVET